MSIRQTIHAVFKEVAQAQGRVLAPLTDELRLMNCGMDSLSFAIVVATLEDKLGADPFSAMDAVEFPETLGDLIHLYSRTTA
jgi:acyl carrier protein